MLEGLEISEINYSELYSPIRIDAETYRPFYMEIENAILSKPYTTLGHISKTFKKGIFDIKSSTYQDSGVPFARISNLKDMGISTNDIIYIPEEENEKNLNTYLKKGDIILSKTATPAASIVQLENCNTSQDTVAIKLKDNSKINSGYLVPYLNSRYGFLQMQRWFTGNIQMHLNLTDSKGIFVFQPNENFQKNISSIFWKSFDQKEQSQTIYQSAVDLLLYTLGLENFNPSQEAVNIKNFSESFGSSGRLDAEYYQPKYEEIENHILSFKNGYTTISSEFEISKEIIDRSKKAYNYTEISDVNVSDGSVDYNLIETEDLPANGKLLLKERQIIISKVRPYRGAIGIIRNAPENYVGSGAFTVLSEVSFYKLEVLQVLLRSKPYQELIMKFNVGSSYPVVKDEDILQLPIPVIDIDKQQEIAALVEESFKLKKQSEHLLEVAKRAVEIAIEQDEETAMEYISKETS